MVGEILVIAILGGTLCWLCWRVFLLLHNPGEINRLDYQHVPEFREIEPVPLKESVSPLLAIAKRVAKPASLLEEGVREPEEPIDPAQLLNGKQTFDWKLMEEQYPHEYLTQMIGILGKLRGVYNRDGKLARDPIINTGKLKSAEWKYLIGSSTEPGLLRLREIVVEDEDGLIMPIHANSAMGIVYHWYIRQYPKNAQVQEEVKALSPLHYQNFQKEQETKES